MHVIIGVVLKQIPWFSHIFLVSVLLPLPCQLRFFIHSRGKLQNAFTVKDIHFLWIRTNAGYYQNWQTTSETEFWWKYTCHRGSNYITRTAKRNIKMGTHKNLRCVTNEKRITVWTDDNIGALHYKLFKVTEFVVAEWKFSPPCCFHFTWSRPYKMLNY